MFRMYLLFQKRNRRLKTRTIH